MKRMMSFIFVSCLLGSDVHAADRLQRSSSHYQIAVRTEPRRGAGLFTATTGSAHEVTGHLRQVGELLALSRDCVRCSTGNADYPFVALRSHSTNTTYNLGTNSVFELQPSALETCLNASDVNAPWFSEFDAPDGSPGLRASWIINGGDDAFLVTQDLVAHGADLLGSNVQLSTTVTNAGAVAANIGIRSVLPIRASARVTPVDPAGILTQSNFYTALRPTDPPAVPFAETEVELIHPAARMWQAHCRSADPSVRPCQYSIAGTITGPSTLDPPPTVPDIWQMTAMSLFAGDEAPLGGALSACFDWRVPVPPREVRTLQQMGVVYVWGPTASEGMVLMPGESRTVTQYFVAFIDYPLHVDAGTDVISPCIGGATSVPLAGAVEFAEPTSAEVHVNWTSSDPRLSFEDASSLTTNAIFTGSGIAEAILTVSVGAYEASDTVLVTVEDTEPPVVIATASPAVLWAPNHRLIPVILTIAATDDCGSSAAVRLIRAESNQPPDSLGDGSTDSDIQGADIGTDDRHVLLRAERQGSAARRYELEYEVEDAGGNVTRTTAVVRVPHDQRPVPRGRRR